MQLKAACSAMGKVALQPRDLRPGQHACDVEQISLHFCYVRPKDKLKQVLAATHSDAWDEHLSIPEK